MGWEALENDGKSRVSVSEAQKQLIADYAACFGTPAGVKVLEDLMGRTIEQPTMPGTALDGTAIQTLMAIREGENNLYRYIKSMIKKGKS